MAQPQLMINSIKGSFQYNSLPTHVQNGMKEASYKFGVEFCKNVGIVKNAAVEFIARELTYFFPQLLLTRYPDLTFRLYTPILGAPIHQKNVSFRMANIIGQAKFKNTRANDFDFADANITEEMKDILQTGMAISYSFVERKACEAALSPAAQAEAANILRVKMEALVRMNEAKLNNLFFHGDTDSSTYGLLTDPTIPSDTVGTAWSSATNEQKLEDILSCYNTVVAQSNGVFRPNILAMSLSAFTDIQARPRSTYSDWTLPKWAEANLPGIDTIIADPYLDAEGDSGSNMIIALHRDERNANMIVSANLEGLPLQYEGQVEKLPFITRATGYNVLQSQAAFRLSGL